MNGNEPKLILSLGAIAILGDDLKVLEESGISIGVEADLGELTKGVRLQVDCEGHADYANKMRLLTADVVINPAETRVSATRKGTPGRFECLASPSFKNKRFGGRKP